MKTKEPFRLTWKMWLFNPFFCIGYILDTTVFKEAPVKTEEEKIAEQLEEAHIAAEQAARTIRDHMFTQHMARARIKALENWNHGVDLLCDHMNNSPRQG